MKRTISGRWRDFCKSVRVIGFWPCVYATFFYRPVMRIAHRFNWHHAPPIYPEGDTQLWCKWCGFQQIVGRELRFQGIVEQTPASINNLIQDYIRTAAKHCHKCSNTRRITDPMKVGWQAISVCPACCDSNGMPVR